MPLTPLLDTSCSTAAGKVHWIELPLPPNRTGGFPASGSPVDGVTFVRIDRPTDGLQRDVTAQGRQSSDSASVDDLFLGLDRGRRGVSAECCEERPSASEGSCDGARVSRPETRNQKREALHAKVHDPRLALVQRQAGCGHPRVDLLQSRLRGLAGAAQHHEVIGITNHLKAGVGRQMVQGGEVVVAQQAAENSPPRRSEGRSPCVTAYQNDGTTNISIPWGKLTNGSSPSANFLHASPRRWTQT